MIRRLNINRGFALAGLLMVAVTLVIIIMTVGVIAEAMNRPLTAINSVLQAIEDESIREQIQIAIADYMNGNLGNASFTSEKVTIDGESYDIIDMCMLQSSYDDHDNLRLPKELFVSCLDIDTDESNLASIDNVFAEEGSLNPEAPYSWVIDNDGQVVKIEH